MKWYKERISFRSGEVELYGEILVPDGEGPFPGAVMCHGMASDSRSMRPSAQRLVRQAIAILTFDFRGHGKSGGVLDGNLDQDVVAAVKLLQQHPKIDRDHVALVGHSMGALAALYASTVIENIKALVFISGPAEVEGFTQLWDPLRQKAKQTGNHIVEFPHSGPFPMLGWFNGQVNRLWMWIRKYRLRIDLELDVEPWFNLNPAANISKIGSLPKLFVHCKGDKWVPYQNTVSLYDQAGSPKDLILTEAGFHVSPLLPGKLRQRWMSWLVSKIK
jgi:pimeloyl-ACP methyl ester carboxylesterase